MRYCIPLAFLLAACGGNEASNGEFDPPEGYESRSGEQLYQKYCTMCHGADGKQGTGGAADLTTSKMDDSKVIDLLKKGRNGMPPQMHQFESEEEVTNVVEYLKTLRK